MVAQSLHLHPPEAASVTTRRLQVYPRESTKAPPTASIERGGGKAPFCRRQKVGLPTAILRVPLRVSKFSLRGKQFLLPS